MARIEIRRVDEFKDAVRAYQVELDGEIIGSLKRGELNGFDIQPGRHRLRLKIDWCSSPYVYLEIQLGQVMKFQCGNNVPMFLELIYVSFLRNKYLWLRRVD
jgi:hypothetical protein